MIAQVKDAKRRTRFANACRGLPVLDALLPLDCALFRKSQPWRFYAGPTLALGLSGNTAWHKAETLTVFGLPQGGLLPLPAVDEALWTQLNLCREAPAARVAAALYPADPARQADFYSELCTKRSRGRAMAWTLEQGSAVVCTVGAYALCNGQAYMACGQTAEPLRGRGIGGRLIVEMADSLAAEGLRPVFLCAPERVRFYTRLGFVKLAEYARYVPEE